MKLHEQIQVTAELIGRPLSDVAVTVLTRELERYPEADVRAALHRCTREAPRNLTLAEITSRLPGAHLLADEAWAIASQAYDEEASMVWTLAISEAFGVVRGLPDRVAARMAFKAAYDRIIAALPPGPAEWRASLGTDSARRGIAVREGIDAGRLLPADRHRLLGGAPERPLLPPEERDGSGPVELADMQATVARMRVECPDNRRREGCWSEVEVEDALAKRRAYDEREGA